MNFPEIVSHHNFDEMLDAVNRGVDIHGGDEYGNSALHIAVENNLELDYLQFLIEECQIDLEIPANLNETVLMVAVKKSPLKVVKFLLDHHAELERKNYLGETALNIAIYSARWDVAQLLLEQGADIDNQDRWGCTALMAVIRRGNLSAVKFILTNHGDVNIVDNENYTALMIAARHDYWEIAQLLVDAGANLDVRNQYGLSACNIASCCGHQNFLSKLQNLGADAHWQCSPLNLAISDAEFERLQNLYLAEDATFLEKLDQYMEHRVVYENIEDISKLRKVFAIVFSHLSESEKQIQLELLAPGGRIH